MSYSVSGLVRDFQPDGYPSDQPIVPHGMSVIVNAPAVFRVTATTDPVRHRDAAGRLGADIADVDDADAGALLADRIITLMRRTDMPNGLTGVGYRPDDVGALTAGALPQRRLLDNAPVTIDRAVLRTLFEGAMSYW
jgi:alcohol dehydrogenase class IV